YLHQPIYLSVPQREANIWLSDGIVKQPLRSLR
ncbi:hypothetical protein LCGC14_1004130, partial [marine sediment metagenome]